MADLTHYNSIRETIGYGDVLLFSGKGGISDVIKDFTFSEYSHAAICIWMSPVVDAPSRLFCVESTTLNDVPDISGEYRKGVQCVALGQRLEGYNGKCWLLRQKNALSNEEKIKLVTWLLQQEVDKVDYDEIGGVMAVLGLSTHEDLRKLFCSELVAKALQIANRLPYNVNPSAILPKHIANFDSLCCPELILDETLIG